MADSMGAAGTGGSGGPNGEGATQPLRGVYWKRNDSMRLVHLLIDPELKPSFIATEAPQPRGAADSNGTTFKQFWQAAATKFNDEDWQPPHLFPNDPHLARCRAFTPTKKSKEVDNNYLREKYKALKRQFNNSVKRWEEGGQSRIENFWKCSGTAPGTSDEGCWYMFLVLWVNKHEELLNVILDKQINHQYSASGHSVQGSLAQAGGGGSSRKRPRLEAGYLDDLHECAPDLQIEMKMESLFKQQAEVLKYVSMCFSNINDAMEEDQRDFWRKSLVTAQAQLQHIQAKLPQPPPPPPPG